MFCNGPFMLADMKKDESYTLVKNPNYYNADEVQIDTVNYVFLNAPETVKMAFDNGELDIATSVNSDALKAYTGTDKLMSSDRIGYRYYEFNCSKEPFNDARVRRALTLALNRKITPRASFRMRRCRSSTAGCLTASRTLSIRRRIGATSSATRLKRTLKRRRRCWPKRAIRTARASRPSPSSIRRAPSWRTSPRRWPRCGSSTSA